MMPISGKGEHRAFELEGSYMENREHGLHHENILVGTLLPWKDLKSAIGRVVTVVSQPAVAVRRLQKVEKDRIELAADNANYEAQVVEKQDILELWLIEGAFDIQLNAPTLMENRMMRIEDELSKLKGS